MLHEQDFDGVALVKRDRDVLKLGPFQFVTVKDGSLAGACVTLGLRGIDI